MTAAAPRELPSRSDGVGVSNFVERAPITRCVEWLSRWLRGSFVLCCATSAGGDLSLASEKLPVTHVPW